MSSLFPLLFVTVKGMPTTGAELYLQACSLQGKSPPILSLRFFSCLHDIVFPSIHFSYTTMQHYYNMDVTMLATHHL